jgi:hypothetical protein
VLAAITDVEAASRCSAFIGSFDAHMSELMIARMISALGHMPPFYSFTGTFCSSKFSECRLAKALSAMSGLDTQGMAAVCSGSEPSPSK